MAYPYDDDTYYEESGANPNLLTCRTCHASVEKWSGHAPAHINFHTKSGDVVITREMAEK